MSGFLFLRPWFLLLLPLVPLVLYLFRSQDPGRNTPWRKVVDPWLLDALLVAGPVQKGGGKARTWLSALALSLAILALAGPSWQRLPPPAFQPRVPPLALLLDLSTAMDEEAVAQARITLTKLLKSIPQRPVSLWTFSDRAWRVMPPSEDLRLLEQLVFTLSPDLLPTSGRNLARALEEVAASQKRRGQAGELVVIGRDSDPAAEALAGSLEEQGHRIWAVAVPGGDEASLQRLAEAGGGQLFREGQVQDLVAALEPQNLEMSSGAAEPVPVDAGPWLVLLLLPLVLLRFRAPSLLLICVFLVPPGPVEAAWGGWFHNRNQEGWALLQADRYLEAAAAFTDPLWQGIAYYRAADYRAAAERFSRVDTALAHYNRGNALMRLGDLQGARRAYERALELDPGFSDARYNLGLLQADSAFTPPAKPGGRDDRNKQGSLPKPASEAQELLDVDRNLKLPLPEAVPEEELKSSLGGGMMLTPDSTDSGGGKESEQTGQMYREGESERREEERLSRKGSREQKGAAVSAAGALPGNQPPPAEADASQAPDRPGSMPSAEEQGSEPLQGGEPDDSAGQGKAGKTGVKGSSGEKPAEEEVRSMEVWLESIEEDPAELLRALFRQQLEREEQ